MFNIEETLSEYGLTPEKYEELLTDCQNRVHRISMDLDWQDINDKYKVDFNHDTTRKACQPPIFGGIFVKEYYDWKYTKKNDPDDQDYLECLREKEEQIFKEKKKLYDQRREYNKLLTSDARAEHLMEEMIKAANNLNHDKPLITSSADIVPYRSNRKKQAVLCLADWHYGMVTDNIWNTYNTDICRERVSQLAKYVKEYLKVNDIVDLNILMLGDFAHGGIHTTCRVKSEEDVCDQLMNVSEILAEFVNDLSHCVYHVNVYSCYGNHMRTIQDKKESVHSDNMEKIVPWWMKERLKKNKKVNIIESEYKEFTPLKVFDYNICAVHGDLEKDMRKIGITINTIFTKKFNESIDYTISADKHHIEEFGQLGIRSILVPCLCGTDDHANDRRLYSDAGQTLLIFNDEYGCEATYHIPFK